MENNLKSIVSSSSQCGTTGMCELIISEFSLHKLGWSRSFGVLLSYKYNSVQFVQLVVCVILLSIAMLIAYFKKYWFIIDSARTNPYKLVYKVTKFARQHKVPIRRSTFTYCEDDIPSGLDLGKSKYSGPFTTEELKM